MRKTISLLVLLLAGIVARSQEDEDEEEWYLNPMALHIWTDTASPGNDVPGLVRNIDLMDEVDFEQVGFPMIDPLTGEGLGYTRQYQNFLKLSQLATTDELVALTGHDSGPVACYAALALVDRHYQGMPQVFEHFLNKDMSLWAADGCFIFRRRLTLLVYDRMLEYFENMIPVIDSVILFTHHLNTVMLRKVLSERLPERYLPRIKFLAYTWNRVDAILYLNDLHKPEDKDSVHRAAFLYLHRANLKTARRLDQVLKILLESRNADLNTQIIKELKDQKVTAKDQPYVNMALGSYGLDTLR